ncbi:MAG: AIR carboxylase family protein [Chitinophagales bacterium]|nr:AIR carboxylase family protein [Sphingobacteriales bacterium]MBP9141201.1 AIR carboxylase family protein [Chitinophagales bacterium]MDA0198122.1 AIR carboxylase family protein [Bacteroidota bacterium]MBK6889267.1 AIR carboxylase family protein [Sphingobacteriales bacterium]MBK8679868.1 AIR carboxylase family protein [Sphingobacteriales bacterium]
MDCLLQFDTPQLSKIHSGKVRDSFRVDAHHRLIAVTDRLSAFDQVLETPIPFKGAVLNSLSNWWFQQTADIIKNHFVREIDPCLTIVHEVKPIKIEMVVRGYLTGSMWRGYSQGERTFSGVTVPDGLTQNQAFPQPIVTPTTKEKTDRPITPADIAKEGWASVEIYAQMEKAALALYQRGASYLASKGIILVDTKYEFGLLNGDLILIDEIHTPDSSRFWDAHDYAANPVGVVQRDKEFTRQWLLANRLPNGNIPAQLSNEVAIETSKRYIAIYESITGQRLPVDAHIPIRQRMAANMVAHGLIKDGYVALVMGAATDIDHAEKIKSYLRNYDVKTIIRVFSANKNAEDLHKIINCYNNSIEPGVVIAIAGRSNALGALLAANLNIPVINCPPFKELSDIMLNINSSLMNPAQTPAGTVVHPDNAALLAARCLNLPRLRTQINHETITIKQSVREADAKFKTNW